MKSLVFSFVLLSLLSSTRIARADGRPSDAAGSLPLFPFCSQSFGVINSSGELAVPLKYQWIGDFLDGKAVAIQNEKYGIIDTSGKILLPFQYDDLGPWSGDRIRMAMGSLYGFVDWKGRTVVRPQYQDVGIFTEGRAWVAQKGLRGFIDLEGQVKVPISFVTVHDFHEGLAVVLDGQKWGYVDPDGRWAIPARYDAAGDFSDGLAGVGQYEKDGGDCDFIDKKGAAVFSRPCDEGGGLPQFQDGAYKEYQYDPPTKTAYWVYYGTRGQILRKVAFDPRTIPMETALPPVLWVAPPKPTPPGVWKVRNLATPFRVAQAAQRWGYIDCSGTIRVQPRYDYARPFQEGLAVADQGPDLVWIGPSGKELFRKPKSLYGKNVYFAQNYHEGLIRFMDRGKLMDAGGGGAGAQYDDVYGAADRKGNIMLPPVFSELGIPSDGLVFGTLRKVELLGDRVVSWGGGAMAFYCLNGSKAFDDPHLALGFSEGLASVRSGYIDKTGKEIFASKYWIENFFEGLAVAMIKKHKMMERSVYGYIDKTGRLSVPARFCFADNFSGGLAAVQEREDGNFGFIDHHGNIVLAPRWGSVHGFHEGLALASDPSRQAGFIDMQGRWVVPPQFDFSYDYDSDFRGGLAMVRQSQRQRAYYYDTHGRLVFSFVWVKSDRDDVDFYVRD